MSDVNSLVAELRELLATLDEPRPEVIEYGGVSVSRWRLRIEKAREEITSKLPALLDALTPKEAELVKPPREYEVSGDAVGEVQDGLSRAIAAQLRDIANIGARTPAVGGIPAGMVAWAGGDSAPEDWGEPYLMRSGRMFRPGHNSAGPNWTNCGGDIIAYTPKALTASHDAARERIADDWACPDCRCRTFARIDIMLIDGSFAPGPNVRCVSCKADWRLLAALPTTDGAEPFQARVQPWLIECFGPEIAADKVERNDRFVEESLELVQSLGYTAERAHALVDYVFERPLGEPSQEVGGVMVTLAALCLASNLDMAEAGETELARINVPEIVAKIRAKQAAKPTGSALPIATPPPTDASERMREALDGVMVGGNHLAHVLIGKLGAGFAEKFPPETDPQEALRVLCATDTFEIWCCWRTIMLARAKVSALPLFDEGRL